MADTNDAVDMGLMCMIYIKLFTEVSSHKEERRYNTFVLLLYFMCSLVDLA